MNRKMVMEKKFPNVIRWLRSREQFPRMPSSTFVSAPGFSELYVRYGLRLVRDQMECVITIARIQAEKPGEGTFTRFLENLSLMFPTTGIYVECVHNPRFGDWLLRHGFEQVAVDPSYYRAPQAEIEAAVNKADDVVTGEPVSTGVLLTLDQIPIETLRQRIGSRVRSLATGTFGILVHVSDETDREDYTIDIDWANGNQSKYVWHFWCDQIEFVESEGDEAR